MKICTKCGKEKNINEFPKNSRSKDGFNCVCKICVNEINKKYRKDNHEKVKEARKAHYQANIEKMRLEKIKYNDKTKEKKKAYDLIYRELNKDKIKKYKKDWELANKDNPINKIKKNLRRRINHVLKNNKKSNTTFELIGCTPEFFKDYIASLFKDGMSWDNYGEWHIDHITPCFTFDLSKPEEQNKCFHYSNQRPLWAKENLTRSRIEFYR